MDSLCGKHSRAYNGVGGRDEDENTREDWLPHEISNFCEIFRNKFQLQWYVICGNGKSWISAVSFEVIFGSYRILWKTAVIAIEIMQIIATFIDAN